MERVFLQVLKMSMAGSACVLFVLALRMFLRKKPRSFSYVLWAVVFLRLLCPFALQSRYFGLALGNMEQTLETAAYEQELVQYQLLVHKDGSVVTMGSRNVPGTPAMPDPFPSDPTGGNFPPQEGAWGTDRVSGDYPDQRDFIDRRYNRSAMLRLERGWVTAGSLIWAAGVAVLLGYSLLSYLLLRRRLRQAVRVQEDVYESDRIGTPFLLGILDPRVYLPMGMPREVRAFVLAHELAHLKRGDYLVKVVTWLALSLHWFNPLVWLAYGLMAHDMEMSCDERVIRRLGEGSKKAYSRALLTISGSCGGNMGRHLPVSAPLSFGENDIRSRVKNVLAYRGVKLGTGAALALLLAAVGLVLLTDRQTTGEDAPQESAAGMEAAMGKQQGGSESGTDLSEEEGGYDLTEETLKNPEEQVASPLAALREMDRGSDMTWELLQVLVEKENPRLEDYAGYAGAVWPDEDEGDRHSLNQYFFYFLHDPDTDRNYRLGISFWKENVTLDSVYLQRESDGDTRLLYREAEAEGRAPYRYTEMDAFRRELRQLGDWVSSWELPHEEQVQVGAYRADIGILGGGVLFTWKEEDRDLEQAWAPEAWKSAGGFVRTEKENEAPFIFDSDGRLTGLEFFMNHTGPNGPAEVLEGCREQAVMVSMNHDLYTVSELDELAQAGRPVPEEEATADFWYIGFAREDAPYGYVLFLAERYYTREEAVAMARSIRFTETAWDSASP